MDGGNSATRSAGPIGAKPVAARWNAPKPSLMSGSSAQALAIACHAAGVSAGR